jgi:hypothetical protein
LTLIAVVSFWLTASTFGPYIAFGIAAATALLGRTATSSKAWLVLIFGSVLFVFSTLSWTLDLISNDALAVVTRLPHEKYDELAGKVRASLKKDLPNASHLELTEKDVIRVEIIQQSGYSRLILIGAQANLPVTTILLLLVAFLLIYSFVSRRKARSVNPREVKELTAIVSIDDEMFLLLGLALFVQRLLQFVMLPVEWLLKPLIAGRRCALTLLTKLLRLFSQQWRAPVETFDNYFAAALGALAMTGAILLISKLLLFGFAYGWDLAGLSINHAIYVTRGSSKE